MADENATTQTEDEKAEKPVKAVVLHTEFTNPDTGKSSPLGAEVEVSQATFDAFSELADGLDKKAYVPALAKAGTNLAKRAAKAKSAGLVSTPAVEPADDQG